MVFVPAIFRLKRRVVHTTYNTHVSDNRCNHLAIPSLINSFAVNSESNFIKQNVISNKSSSESGFPDKLERLRLFRCISPRTYMHALHAWCTFRVPNSPVQIINAHQHTHRGSSQRCLSTDSVVWCGAAYTHVAVLDIQYYTRGISCLQKF